MTTPSTTPPGWYDDGSGNERYWDGSQWTQSIRPFANAIDDATMMRPVRTPAAAEPAASVAPAAADASAPPTAGYGVPPAPQGFTAAGVVSPARGAAGASAYPTTTATYAPPPEASAKKPLNVIGLVALILGVVGFIFACIPGALVLGWVALPIAFVLSIVALFLKGKGKGMAIAGLIVSIVGTIIGVIVFFSVVASSFSDAFGGTGSSVTQPSAGTKSDADASAKSDASAEKGTRENPASIGSVISGNDYDVKINSITPNATDKVLAANPFNDKPKAGYAYALINATITYTGDDKGETSFVSFAYVTADGHVIDGLDSLAVAPDPTLDLKELYKGASATGNVVLAIPVSADGTLRVSPGMIADDVFVALK